MRVITLQGAIIAGVCAVIFASLTLAADDFQWDWRHSEALTSKQSLRHAKVSATERAAIARAIANALKPEIGGMGGESQQELEDNAVDTPVKLVDLNGDGVAEVIAQGTPEDGGCSPTGNCRFWIFQKSGNEYRPLFYREAIQSFTLQQSRSNGFTDLVIRMQGSATESTLWLLRYSEGKYQESGCYDANWSVLEGGAVHELKEPRLTPCAEK
ncbi:MAG: hypothetical protein ACLQVL_05780 [Terriglobia bacterium]